MGEMGETMHLPKILKNSSSLFLMKIELTASSNNVRFYFRPLKALSYFRILIVQKSVALLFSFRSVNSKKRDRLRMRLGRWSDI